MEEVTIKMAHKRRWGYTTASVMALLQQKEEEAGEWMPVLASDMQEALSIHPSGVVTARERLRADQVIEVNRVGNTYEYRINHQRLAAIDADN